VKKFLKAMDLVTRVVLGDKPTSVKPRKKRKYKRRAKK